MASPRCHSHESSGGGRCPSNESVYSSRMSHSMSGRAMSPGTVNATLAASAAAAANLLPQQSAAMAAYLNVAAVAAQQNRLLLASPLGVGLTQQQIRSMSSSSSISPPSPSPHHQHGGHHSNTGGSHMHHNMIVPSPHSSSSPLENDSTTVLDFSKKRHSNSSNNNSNNNNFNNSNNNSDSNDNDNNETINLSKSNNSPLDLSVNNRNRKRNNIDMHASPQHHINMKMSRTIDYKSVVSSPWSTTISPQLQYFAAASLSPNKNNNNLNNNNNNSSNNNNNSNGNNMNSSNEWNGKSKMSNNAGAGIDATKALEKMSELSRLGGDEVYRSSNNNMSSGIGMGGGGGGGGGVNSGSAGRHSAWQSHWLNKGADSAKDVLKCVWCKQSFPSLAAMTTHMKETKHCGVNVPPISHLQQAQQQQTPSTQSSSSTSQSNSHSTNSSSHKSNQSELNLLIKETMPLPRKLVRGQDVWLGKGAEQTRQILKCMWCGQSFRTLAEMTSHMQQTQHYTNIISQEQIISWKSTDGEKTGSGPGNGGAGGGAGGGGPGGREGGGPGAGNDGPGGRGGGGNTAGGGNQNQANSQSHVSAVLTCKVCDQAFSSLKELSNHMVKNSHYKEHIMRSITESGGKRRQTREKRKKSLPVRKLLELERAQIDFKNGENISISNNKPIRDVSAGRITCEKCNDKIDTALFVDHIRQCVGGGKILNSAHKLKSALMSNTIIPPDSLSPLALNSSRDGRKSIGDDMSSPVSARLKSSPSNHELDLLGSSNSLNNKDNSEKSSSPSVLNAIEQLIEKSFDTRSRHNNQQYGNANQISTPLGSSILKRLGIDESVDYTKPLVESQTMNLLKNYHQVQYAAFGSGSVSGRERSGSESSSISERGSSRVDSLTPDKKYDSSMPENLSAYSDRHMDDDNDDSNHVKIKKEVSSDDELPLAATIHESKMNRNRDRDSNIEIKKELIDDYKDDVNSTMRPPTTASNNTDTDNENPEPLIKIRNNILSSPAPSPRTLSSHNVPMSPAASPSSDHNSTASRSTPGTSAIESHSTPSNNKKSSSNSSGGGNGGAGGSLGALSSMFDSLSGNNNSNAESTGQSKKGNAHPLAALQKLCDKTETQPNSRSSNSSQGGTLLTSTSSSSSSSTLSVSMTGGGNGGQPQQQQNNRSSSGSILAFSWACNDGIMTEDSLMKCAYCDTTFSSKGAYRHHLSKTHFVNDEIPESPSANNKSNSKSSAASHHRDRDHHHSHHRSSVSPHSPKSTGSNSANGVSSTPNTPAASSASTTTTSSSSTATAANTNAAQTKSPPPGQQPQSSFDESPHSKFLKYTELAKQLSSKYV